MTAHAGKIPKSESRLLMAVGAVLMFTLTLGVGTIVLAFDQIDGNSEIAVAEPQVPAGQAIFASNCAVCHGANGEGKVGPQLSEGQVVERLPDIADHKSVVVNGRGAMPSFARILSRDEIQAVVEYERSGL